MNDPISTPSATSHPSEPKRYGQWLWARVARPVLVAILMALGYAC